MGEKREIPVDFLRPLLTEGACVLDSGRTRRRNALSGACSLSLLSDRVYNTINDTKEKVKHVGLLNRISSCFTKSSFASCSCDERGQAIDDGARQILEALEEAGKEGYIVGGCVRDLAMGKVPHDWDITTSARPEEMLSIAALRGWKAIDGGGRRFGTVIIVLGGENYEVTTFRSERYGSDAHRPSEVSFAGTLKEDLMRRDFTVNGLFYNIRDFSVIDWVGGMSDIKKKVIRSIGDPEIRFQEDPVRMMRAIKFSSRLGFKIEKKTAAAMKKYHAMILSASLPRVCEEVFRLFPYGHSAEAFKLMWECGMMGDLLPELAKYVDRSGGKKSPTWKYLEVLDEYEKRMSAQGFEVPNGLRAAVLMTGLLRESKKDGMGRKVMDTLMQSIKPPKATYFTAVLLMDSLRRFAASPTKGKSRFVHNRDFLDALDYNRIVLRAEKKDEKILNEWSDLYEQKGNK